MAVDFSKLMRDDAHQVRDMAQFTQTRSNGTMGISCIGKASLATIDGAVQQMQPANRLYPSALNDTATQDRMRSPYKNLAHSCLSLGAHSTHDH